MTPPQDTPARPEPELPSVELHKFSSALRFSHSHLLPVLDRIDRAIDRSEALEQDIKSQQIQIRVLQAECAEMRAALEDLMSACHGAGDDCSSHMENAMREAGRILSSSIEPETYEKLRAALNLSSCVGSGFIGPEVINQIRIGLSQIMSKDWPGVPPPRDVASRLLALLPEPPKEKGEK